jgi:hypothetical protein
MTKGNFAGYSSLLGLAILLLPSPAMTQESWTGNWRTDGHTVDGMVCRQKWTCVDPKSADNGKGSGDLVFEPKERFTEGVCLSAEAGSECGKCGAEQPPEQCTVTAK